MRNGKFLKRLVLAMMVAVGVVISPLLPGGGFCAHATFGECDLCDAFWGHGIPSACAVAIGVIRMSLMGIPPLALTGAVFGAFYPAFSMLKRVKSGQPSWVKSSGPV